MHNDDLNILQILDQSACLSKSQLIGYLNHKLYPEELRTVELHLSSCTLCSEALEGLEAIQNVESFIGSIVPPVLPAIVLPEKLAEKKEPKPDAKPAYVPSQKHLRIKNNGEYKSQEPNKYNSNPRGFWFKSIGIAAALVIGFCLIWYFELGSHNQHENIISENLKNVDSDKARIPVGVALESGKPNLDSVKIAIEKKAKDSLYLATAKAEKLRKQKDSLALFAATNESDTSIISAAKPLLAANEQVKENNAPEPNAKKQSLTADLSATTPKKEEDSKTSKNDFESGKQQYKQNNFASALLYFKTAESNDKSPNHWEAVYLSGLCNKGLKKKKEAIKYFERVVASKTARTKDAQKQLDELNKQK